MFVPYKPIPNHPINFLYKQLNKFYLNVFYKYKMKKHFSARLLIPDDFLDIYNHHKVVREPLRNFYFTYHTLSKIKQKIIKQAFRNNRSIKLICSGKIKPYEYDDLPKEITSILKPFDVQLWDYIIKRDRVELFGGSVKDYYTSLRDANNNIKACPFCKIENLLSGYDSDGEDGKREAFDHYLNKAKYPFISVNFLNLFPTCHQCNSTYKDSISVIYNDISFPKKRKVAFYPFDKKLSEIKLKLELENLNTYKVNISSKMGYVNEIQSWDNIYQIQKRYTNSIKDKCEVYDSIIVDLLETTKDIDEAKRIYFLTLGNVSLIGSELQIAYGNKVFSELEKNGCHE